MIAPTTVQKEKESVVDSFSIETVSGRFINPIDPDPAMIDINDIAWALSRISRFAGHTITTVPYNVAQHSVYVAELVESYFTTDLSKNIANDIIGTWQPEPFDLYDDINYLIKLALIHDAHEAYTGDFPSPIKRNPIINEALKVTENKLDAAIFKALGILPPTERQVQFIKFFDKLAQAIEAYQFMPSRGRNWNLPKPSLALLQRFHLPQTPLEAYVNFLDKYKNL